MMKKKGEGEEGEEEWNRPEVPCLIKYAVPEGTI